MNIDAGLFLAKGVDIIVNVISGSVVVAIAFGAWIAKERAAEKRSRQLLMKARASRLALLRAELETIISFTSHCTMAANALEQFATYQQWLVANGLLSWKQNRLIVNTWQQTSGSAAAIRLGQVSIGNDVIDDLVVDMKKTEFPQPEDDNFRWSATGTAVPVEREPG